MIHQRGFTLIEIAIVLTIVALLSVGAITVLQLAILRTRIAETQTALREAREAVVAFAVVNRSLPCPAASAVDGTEQSRSGGHCASRRGLLPWQTLGVRGIDGWGNRLGYLASPGLVAAPGSGIALAGVGDIELVTRDATGAPTAMNSAAAVAFALWSHGENGRGATTQIGSLIADDSTTNADEKLNSSQPASTRILFTREGSVSTAAAGGEFDDLVEWESRFVLFGRMMTAGQLP
jgi:prepilin-type N-terminal cleavage/methylation domain-containing protein